MNVTPDRSTTRWSGFFLIIESSERSTRSDRWRSISPSRGRKYCQSNPAISGLKLQQLLFRNPRRLFRSQSGIDVGINLKNLVQPRDIENVFHIFLDPHQPESAAIFLDV